MLVSRWPSGQNEAGTIVPGSGARNGARPALGRPHRARRRRRAGPKIRGPPTSERMVWMTGRATVFITRRAEFAAAHRLSSPRLSDRENARLYGPCAHKGGHGHNYVLEVTLRGEVDPETGMLIDLKKLKAVIEREVIAKCDHRNLNADPD